MCWLQDVLVVKEEALNSLLSKHSTTTQELRDAVQQGVTLVKHNAELQHQLKEAGLQERQSQVRQRSQNGATLFCSKFIHQLPGYRLTVQIVLVVLVPNYHTMAFPC